MISKVDAMSLRRWLIAGVLIGEAFLASACATLGPAYAPRSVSPADKAIVYVYREFNVLGGEVNPTVFANGVLFSQLPAGGYFVYEAAPGEVELSEKTHAKPSATVHAKAGEVYYVKGTVVPLVGHLDLALVSKEVGEKEIADCKLVPESMAANAQTRADFREVTIPADEGAVTTYPGVAWFSGVDALAGFSAYAEAEPQAIAGTLELTDRSLTFLTGSQRADRTGTGLRIERRIYPSQVD